jgi:hypothetical protein
MTDQPQPATHVPPAEDHGLFAGSIDQVAVQRFHNALTIAAQNVATLPVSQEGELGDEMTDQPLQKSGCARVRGMIDRRLDTLEDVVRELGGVVKVARITRRTPRAVCNGQGRCRTYSEYGKPAQHMHFRTIAGQKCLPR